MYQFKLKSATMAVRDENGKPHGVAVVIPANSVIATVEPVEARAVSDNSTLVGVEWDGKKVRMFLLDLVQRGERVQQPEGT
jgi:hypothetical protein